MWLTLLLAAELLSSDGFSQGLAPVTTGAPRVLLSAQACRSCHPVAHAEWAQSRHGLAWTNAIFQREYRQQPLQWCVHCHAPLAEQLAEIRPVRPTGGAGAGQLLAAEGVTCAVCHLRDGRMVAARRREGSPHDTEAREGFGGPSFCAGCHQFNFPRIEGAGAEAHVVGYGPHPMQDTVAQHARGPRAATACRTCHADSPGGHAYPGGHDPEMLARALTLSICRAGRALRLTVANTGAGHNVPTGDVHRHLTLRAWRPSAPERLFETTFGRRFQPDDAGGKRLAQDTTLPPGTTRSVDADVASLGAPARGEAIRIELRFVYTIDEFPFHGHELTEPTYATVVSRELDWPRLVRCR